MSFVSIVSATPGTGVSATSPSITTPTSSPLVLVHIAFAHTTAVVNSLTITGFGGTATQVASTRTGTAFLSIWSIVGVTPSRAGTVKANFSASVPYNMAVETWSGVDPVNPVADAKTNNAVGTVTLTPSNFVTGDLCAGSVANSLGQDVKPVTPTNRYIQNVTAINLAVGDGTNSVTLGGTNNLATPKAAVRIKMGPSPPPPPPPNSTAVNVTVSNASGLATMLTAYAITEPIQPPPPPSDWSALDGSPGAPPGAAQYPNMFSGWAVRPPWKVAGCDYPVGANPNTTHIIPNAGNIPAGTHLTSGDIFVDGNNVTISGYDLNGSGIFFNNTATGTITITDCINASQIRSVGVAGNTHNVTITYCETDGGGYTGDPNFPNIGTIWTSGTVTVMYCWFKQPQQGLHTVANVLIKYSLCESCAYYAGQHSNCFYINPGSTSANLLFNTIYSHTTQVGGLPIGAGAAIAYFGDGGDFNHSEVGYNTCIEMLSGGTSYLFGYYPTPGNFAADGIVHDNYMGLAPGGGIGMFYNSSPVGHVTQTYTNNINLSDGSTIPGIPSY